MATKRAAVREHYLAEWIEHLADREDDPIDAAELARRMGVTRSAVSKWVSGAIQVDIRKLRKIAGAMGLRPDALLYHPTDASPEARVSRMSPEIIQQMLRRDLGG